MHFTTLFSAALTTTLALAAPVAQSANRDPAPGSCSPVGISPAYRKKVVKQFATDEIVPDLIERIKPRVKVNVDYDGKQVKLGTYFTIPQTLQEPYLTFSAEQGRDPYETKYTYFLVDPDVPQDGSPVQVNFLHWMVSNASPSCAPDESETVVAYQPLTPLSTTQHRYTFLVYREPPNFDPNELLLQIRTPFDLNNYVQDNGLVLVGGNFLKEAAVNGIQSGTDALDTEDGSDELLEDDLLD